MVGRVGSAECITLDPDGYHGMTSGQIAEDLGDRLRGVSGRVVVSEPKNGGMAVWEPLLRTALAYSSSELRIVGHEWFYQQARGIYGAGSIAGNPQQGYYLCGSSRKDEALDVLVA